MRYKVMDNEGLTRFVYYKGELLYEKGGDREISYSHGKGIEANQVGEEIYYYHYDELQSTISITNSRGAIENQYRYNAFGEDLDKSENIFNRIQYTGQQYDLVTGQYYLRARFYNPTIGRFTQEDIYRGDGLNLYAYCANNPVIYYDPSGCWGLCPNGKTNPTNDSVDDVADSARRMAGADVDHVRL